MSIQAAEEFEENGQYEEAYAEYKKSYMHNQNDLSLLAQLGHIAIMLDKKDEAEEFYKKMLLLDATNPTAYEQLMDIYLETDKYQYYVYRGNYHIIQQQFEHALNDFKKAVNHAGVDHKATSSVRFVMGTLYEQLGNTNKAIDEYLKVLEYEHENEEAYIRLANLYSIEGINAGAIETLERAMNEGFTSDNIRESLALLYFKNGTPELVKKVSNNELTLLKAKLALGELEEAKKDLEEFKEKYKEVSQFYALSAEYYYTAKEYDKALEAVNTYGQMEPNHPLVFQMSALIYEAKGDEYNSTYNWGKYNLARGNKDIAINELLNAYRIKDDEVSLVATLANLLENSGEKHSAMEFYEKLISLEPNNRNAIEKFARYKESIGDDYSALKYFRQLVEVDKRNFSAMKKVGELALKSRDRETAIEYFKKYLTVAPQDNDYEKVNEQLNKLENNQAECTEECEGLLDKIINFFSKK